MEVEIEHKTAEDSFKAGDLVYNQPSNILALVLFIAGGGFQGLVLEPTRQLVSNLKVQDFKRFTGKVTLTQE